MEYENRRPLSPLQNVELSARETSPQKKTPKRSNEHVEDAFSSPSILSRNSTGIASDSRSRNAAKFIQALNVEVIFLYFQALINTFDASSHLQSPIKGVTPARAKRSIVMPPPSPGDLSAAWELIGHLQHALAEKEGIVVAALRELESSGLGQPGQGQQLSRFLKEQLMARDKQLLEAQEASAVLRGALYDREKQMACVERDLVSKDKELKEALAERDGIMEQGDVFDTHQLPVAVAVDDDDDDDIGSISFELHRVDHKAGLSCRRHLKEHCNVDDASSDGTVSEAEAAVMSIRRTAGQKTRKVGSVAIAQEGMSSAEKHSIQVVDERCLRSELELMERKCERTGQMLLAANHAVRVLRHKLQKERRDAADLQTEKCRLQAQLLSSHPQLAIEHVHTTHIMQELANARQRVEQLLADKAVLQAKLDAAITPRERSDRPSQQEVSLLEIELQTYREAIAAEKARSDVLQEEKASLEARLSEALGRFGTLQQEASNAVAGSTAVGPALEALAALLQDERRRCEEITATLEAEKSKASARAAELEDMVKAADVAALDAMSAQEMLQSNKNLIEELKQKLASEKGRADALAVHLAEFKQGSDGTLVKIAEDNSNLHGQLALLENKAHEAMLRADALQQGANATQGQLLMVQAAATEAAEHLKRLTISHADLEQELETTAKERDQALIRGDKADLRIHTELEPAIGQLSVQVEEALRQRDLLVAELEDAYSQLQSARSDNEALHTALQHSENTNREAYEEKQMLVERLEAVERRRDTLMSHFEKLKSDIDHSRETEALVMHDNRMLVDSVCDMSTLVESVHILQQRNRVLQAEMDDADSRRMEIVAEMEGQSAAKNSALRRVEALEAAVQEGQAKCQTLLSQNIELKTEIEVERRSAAALTEQYEALQANWDRVQEKAAGLKAELKVAKEEMEHAKRKTEMAELQAKEATAEASATRHELENILSDYHTMTSKLSEAQAVATAATKAAKISEGELVVARQREANSQQALLQLSKVQVELDASLTNRKELVTKKQEVEERCLALEARCLSFESRCQSLTRQLAESQDESRSDKAQADLLNEQLKSAEDSCEDLKVQLAALGSIHERLSTLEADHLENGEWFESLVTELEEKTAQVLSLEKKCEEAEFESARAHSALCMAEGALSAVQEDNEIVRAGLDASRAALEVAESLLDQLKEDNDRLMRNVEDMQEGRAQLDCELAGTKAMLVQEQDEKDCAQHKLSDLSEKHDELIRAYTSLDQEVGRLRSQLVTISMEAEESAANSHTALQEALSDSRQHHETLKELDIAHRQALNAQKELHQQLQDYIEKVDSVSAELSCTRSALEEVTGQRDQLQKQQDTLRLDANAAARDAKLMEQQCAVLREQLAFLEAQTGSGDDALALAREEIVETRAERQQSRQRADALEVQVYELSSLLQGAERELSKAQETADQALEKARKACLAAETADELSQELKHYSKELEQRLDVSEALKDALFNDSQIMRSQLDEVRVELARLQEEHKSVERAGMIRIQTAFESQLSILSRIEDESVRESQLTADKIARLKASIESMSEETAAAQRQQLYDRLTQVEGTLLRLAGFQSDLSVLAEHHKQQVNLTDHQDEVALVVPPPVPHEETVISSSYRHLSSMKNVWKTEKRLLKAVCKLALAVTMDRMPEKEAGQSAESVLSQVEHIVLDNADIVADMGLDRVWAALCGMAVRCPLEASATAALHSDITLYKSKCEQLEKHMAMQHTDMEQISAQVELLLLDVLSQVNGVMVHTASHTTTLPTATNGDTLTGGLGRLPGIAEAVGKAVTHLVSRQRSLIDDIQHFVGGGEDDEDEALQVAVAKAEYVAHKFESMLTPNSRKVVV